jgi:hypothetical protein
MTTFVKWRTRVSWPSIVSLAALAACAPSELEVPANHPGHPAARTGETPKTTPLASTPAPPEPATAEPSPHAGHGEHEATATHACPMHPDVVSKEPGKCPICGMPLELRKAGRP